MTSTNSIDYDTWMLSTSLDILANQCDVLQKYDNTPLRFDQMHAIEQTAQELMMSIAHYNGGRYFGIEHLLAKFSLSTAEGIALLSLSEAILRIPDDRNALALLRDKMLHKNWHKNINLLNVSSLRGLYEEGVAVGTTLVGLICKIYSTKNRFTKAFKNVSKKFLLYVIRNSVTHIGNYFVIGEDINTACRRAKCDSRFLYSFDLLGESARTMEQADEYYRRYNEAIQKMQFYFPIPKENGSVNRANLSVKLSALYPRFELMKFEDIDNILLPRVRALLHTASNGQFSITFDAEECRSTDIYLRVIFALLSEGYTNFGIVIQAYQKRAYSVIKALCDTIKSIDYQSKLMIRLVKGAYWDSEIKYAQEMGMVDYPVFTDKHLTDVNYISCARLMRDNIDIIYPQLATHNAITIATVMQIFYKCEFELQKLYGMGDAVYQSVKSKHNIPVRIYSPVGNMQDLLPYLMRRLLENAASSSFIHTTNAQIDTILKETNECMLFANRMQKHLHKEKIENKVLALVRDTLRSTKNHDSIPNPADIFNDRKNSNGIDVSYYMDMKLLNEAVASYGSKIYKVGSIISGKEIVDAHHSVEMFLPTNNAVKIGEVSNAVSSEIETAVKNAKKAFATWSTVKVDERAEILNKIADSIESSQYEILHLLQSEAGKVIPDAMAEIREAIDFCRYYAMSAINLMNYDKVLPGITGEKNTLSWHSRGVFLCISPWNFPLAIFIGQITAALVTGNTVIAKPSHQTSIIANYITKLMHSAGVPVNVLHLVICHNDTASETLVANDDISGIVFTGSTATAKSINKTVANRDGALVPIIAETGGLNAMIVDSSALLEQAVDDILVSAFNFAGQRCSALRMLYIQEEIYDEMLTMLAKAMNLLKLGDTKDISVDIGPVINRGSVEVLQNHILDMRSKGFNIIPHEFTTLERNTSTLDMGNFFFPHIIEVNSIADIQSEKFGPILHIAKFNIKKLDNVIQGINATGFGLTFGVHSRIESRVQYICNNIKAGNTYINRSIIGAQVESHPFGGEGKSGTGFKAGGPHYLQRFLTERSVCINTTAIGANVELLIN